MKILIAEDDPTFQRVLRSLLAKWGHEPIIAANGDEAWSHLQAADGPRLALLDWDMPGLNGLEVCRHVRSRTTHGYTYVIILTAKSESEDAITALEAGSDDIVTKPFHPHELRARINTAQRILALEESLSQQAYYDRLTGLPNRTLLSERFLDTAESATRNGHMIAVLYIGLDHFKRVKDNLGHAAGDSMLKEITGRLKNCIAGTETLARVGDDEFVCLANVLTVDAAAALAVKVQRNLEVATDAGAHHFSARAAIGISLYPQHGGTFEVLLLNAVAAMYEFRRRSNESRRCPGNDYLLFNEDIGGRGRSRLMLETTLSGALQRDEFVLHYQPIFRLGDMHMAGSEALIRWNDPLRGIVSPGEFIPIAEETGHIASIGNWVLDQACRQAKEWAASSGEHFRVAVNISGSQFSGNELIETISETLARSGLSPGLLELEMTETAMVHDLVKSAKTMKAFRELGVRVALDDFGTGYSCFSYLANLPIDTLKIDRSFLFGIHSDRRQTSVLEAIVALAHKLGITVVAEGIEDANQLEAVRNAGCDEVQGFLFARPGLPEVIRPMRGLVIPADDILVPSDLRSLAERLQSPPVRILF